MNKKFIVAGLGILAIVMIFLTPFFPLDEAIVGILAIIVSVIRT